MPLDVHGRPHRAAARAGAGADPAADRASSTSRSSSSSAASSPSPRSSWVHRCPRCGSRSPCSSAGSRCWRCGRCARPRVALRRSLVGRGSRPGPLPCRVGHRLAGSLVVIAGHHARRGALPDGHGSTTRPPVCPCDGFDDGAPDWLAPTLRHCSRCGGRLAFGPVAGEDRPRYQCADCGYVTYVNPRVVVTTACPSPRTGELVLIRRAIPPGIGTWAQPGGFLEADETVIQGAVRETHEETCLLVEPTDIVGIYSRPRAAVVIVAYARGHRRGRDDGHARVVGGASLRGRGACPGTASASTPRCGPSVTTCGACGRTSTWRRWAASSSTSERASMVAGRPEVATCRHGRPWARK